MPSVNPLVLIALCRMISSLVAIKRGVIDLEFFAGTGSKARVVAAVARTRAVTKIFIVIAWL